MQPIHLRESYISVSCSVHTDAISHPFHTEGDSWTAWQSSHTQGHMLLCAWDHYKVCNSEKSGHMSKVLQHIMLSHLKQGKQDWRMRLTFPAKWMASFFCSISSPWAWRLCKAPSLSSNPAPAGPDVSLPCPSPSQRFVALWCPYHPLPRDSSSFSNYKRNR